MADHEARSAGDPPELDPAMWIWIARMLRNCTAARYAQNKIRMVRLAECSRDVLRDLWAETGIAYDERSPARSAPVSVKGWKFELRWRDASRMFTHWMPAANHRAAVVTNPLRQRAAPQTSTSRPRPISLDGAR
jgi:hypothetical protein